MAYTGEARPGFFGAAVRRRWVTILVGTLIGAVAGVGAAMVAPTTYTSQATLILDPVIGNPFEPGTGLSRTEELAAMQTEASLVTGAEVVRLATESSTEPLPGSPETHVTASSPSNSQVLQISFSAGLPEVATAGAQAFAVGYLEYRRLQAEDAYAAQAEQLQVQVDTTNAVIEATAAELAEIPGRTPTALLLEQQLEVYASQLAQLNLQFTEATTGVTTVGEVITPATTSEASGLPWWAIVIGGIIVGLGLGVLIALGREHADGRVHDPDELTGVGAGHPLAVVPNDPVAIDLRAGSTEGYRLLHAVVLGRHPTAAPVVCVLGTTRSSVADEVGAGLVATAHRLGRTALLVGTELPPGWDSASVLSERSLSDRLTWRRPSAGSSESLAVLPVGVARSEAITLSPDLTRFVDAARSNRDLVVLSGGSSSTAVSRRLAALADLTVVAVELGRDKFDDVVDVVESLRESGVDDIGVVAVAPTGRRPAHRGRAARPHLHQPGYAAAPPPPDPAKTTRQSRRADSLVAATTTEQPSRTTPTSVHDSDRSAGRRVG